MSELRNQFQACLGAKNAAPLLELFGTHDSNDAWTAKMTEIFEVITKQDSHTMWSLLSGVIDSICSDFTADVNSHLDVRIHLNTINGLIKSAHIFFQKSAHRCKELMQVIHRMSGILSSTDIDSTMIQSVKNSICLLCEHLYLKGDTYADENIPEVISYLLLEVLKPTVKDNLIKRLYAMRNGFKDLDLHDPSNRDTKELVLRCFAHPALLKNVDGEKLLVFFLSLSEGKSDIAAIPL
jgi:hypothetical protein